MSDKLYMTDNDIEMENYFIELENLTPEDIYENGVSLLSKYLDIRAKKPRIMINNIEKVTLMCKTYEALTNILKQSECEYTIESELDGISNTSVTIEILVQELCFAQEDFNKIKQAVEGVDTISIHARTDEKISILIGIHDIFIEIDSPTQQQQLSC